MRVKLAVARNGRALLLIWNVDAAWSCAVRVTADPFVARLIQNFSETFPTNDRTTRRRAGVKTNFRRPCAGRFPAVGKEPGREQS